MEEVLNFLKELGVGRRHPHDDFLKEGNDDCQFLKPYGICDYDREEFYHKPYTTFSCHIPGCDRTFETVMQYEAHYNSCHSFTCKECNKNLPNNHLLDLHISETHDFFFKEQVKRKPMYCCFLEECEERFKTPQERKDHCIKIHKYPCDFRFDSCRKKEKKKAKKESKSEKMDIGKTSEDGSEMDVLESQPCKSVPEKNKNFQGFSFGRAPGRRKPIFHNFSKDLMNSLPD